MTAPANSSTGSFSISWTSPTHAASYIARESGTQIYSGSATSRSISGKYTGNYTYSVRACNSFGDCGSWSGGKTTRVSLIPAAPTLACPSTSSGSFTCTWNATYPSSTYKLY
jgi:predicted phage tail protein